MYRKGECADRLSNYLGSTNRTRTDSFRYFVRTKIDGASMGDTSNLRGHPDDFAYKRDKTCNFGDSNPRKSV